MSLLLLFNQAAAAAPQFITVTFLAKQSYTESVFRQSVINYTTKKPSITFTKVEG